MSSALKARIQKAGTPRRRSPAAPGSADVVGVEQAHRQAVAEQWEGQPADPPEYGRLREEGPANVIQQHGGNGDQLEQVGVQVGAQLSLLGFHDLIPPVFQLSLPSGGIPDGFHRWKRASGLAFGLGRGFFAVGFFAAVFLGAAVFLAAASSRPAFWRRSFWPPPFGRASSPPREGCPPPGSPRRRPFSCSPADPRVGRLGHSVDAEGLLEPPARLLEQGVAALGAGLLHRHVPSHEVAPLGLVLVGVVLAAVVGVSPLGGLFEDLAAALGALAGHLDDDGLGVVALRPAGAGQEAAEPAGLVHQIAPALGQITSDTSSGTLMRSPSRSASAFWSSCSKSP